jgi:hypothetical protein
MDWIPALSTTSLLAIALWLFRKIISTRLTNAVRHEYDKKIESLRTTLRQSEESFKAELRAKESQIEALRSGALSGIVNRQAAFYNRQIVAIEQLWDEVVSLAPVKSMSAAMLPFNFEAAVKDVANHPEKGKIFSKCGGNFDKNIFHTDNASKARPFISPLSWALYSAYRAICHHETLKLYMLENGIDYMSKVESLNAEGVTALVKVVLPQYTEYMDKHGSRAFYHLFKELESALLHELDAMLQGKESDKDSIERAAQILKETEKVMEANASLNKSE